MKLEEIVDSRDLFIETYLFEEPELIGDIPIWHSIKNDIKEWSFEYPNKIVDLGNGFKKLDLDQEIFYWFEKDEQILIGSSLEKKSYALVVTMTGKNPDSKNKPPYATDLYLEILNDLKGTDQSLVMSDKILTSSGYDLWKRLFVSGHTILLYDKNTPGASYKKFKTLDELEKYIGIGRNFRNYRFVLSESIWALNSTSRKFSMRRYREENNIL